MGKGLVTTTVLATALCFAVPQAAVAQEAGRFEAFGSFAYLRADLEGTGYDNSGGIGVMGEIAFFVNDWIGIGAEFSLQGGDVDSEVVVLIFPPPDVDFSQTTLLFGPRFRLVNGERMRVGAQAMAGWARTDLDVEYDPDILPVINEPGNELGLTLAGFDEPKDALGLSLGVHLDLDLSDRWVWRVAQPDLLITTFGDDTQAHFRLATGLGVSF